MLDIQDFQSRGQPIISVDTKKKELIGNYKNDGQEWQPKKQPVEVNTQGNRILIEFSNYCPVPKI
jgi:hypothetical protein